MVSYLKKYWLFIVGILFAVAFGLVLVFGSHDVERTEYVAPSPSASATMLDAPSRAPTPNTPSADAPVVTAVPDVTDPNRATRRSR